MPRKQFTIAELQELFRGRIAELTTNVTSRIEQYEAEDPNLRPLPPMTRKESFEMILHCLSLAHKRELTDDECAIFAQLIAVFEQAVRAETLGYKGRYFVMSEDQIKGLLDRR